MQPYNPLDKKNLGASVAEAMLERPVHPLGGLSKFAGAGVYAIYYTGPFKPYSLLAERNREGRFEAPIYVGKAVPEGARKGGDDVDGSKSSALFKRLNDHAKSIMSARESLSIDDFYCRYLVVDDIFIPLGESLLISRFSPIWNNFVDGFGNHNPGKGRFKGLVPRWDVLHPGRAWALNCEKRLETAEQIASEVEARLRSAPVAPHPKLFTDN